MYNDMFCNILFEQEWSMPGEFTIKACYCECLKLRDGEQTRSYNVKITMYDCKAYEYIEIADFWMPAFMEATDWICRQQKNTAAIARVLTRRVC